MLIREQMNMEIFNSAEQSRGYNSQEARKRCNGVFFLGDLQKPYECDPGHPVLAVLFQAVGLD